LKNAYIISTGSELLSGVTPDTNSVYLTSRLQDIGIKVIGKTTAGDNHEQLKLAFGIAKESADIIISTGGLGPTFDDLTKIVACEIMDCSLVIRTEEEERLRNWFARRQRSMPEINLRQAMFPSEAIALFNSRGTAPGMYLQKNGKTMILLPGPPREMQPMYAQEVEPLLQKEFGVLLFKTINRNIKTFGIGESQVENKLGELMNCPKGISMALLADEGEVHIRLAAEAGQQDSQLLDDYTGKIMERMGRDVFGLDHETLAGNTAALLKSQGKNLAVAESCTGGLLGKMVTDLSGSSEYFWGGVISYSNESKQKLLGVRQNTLLQYGAVSPETAREMAEGVRTIAGTDAALAITGIAGPDGGSAEKPVGLVYIALAHDRGVEVKKLRLGLGRDFIRILAAKSALDLLRRQLQYECKY
jgi:competence/damage-inducible protein CinA C-terminal domain